MLRSLLHAIALFAALVPMAPAQAGDYPDHPLRLIVPFAPGGGADLTARLVAEPLGKVLGQPVVVENKPGAGGTIGATQVARAAPDGYTLLYTTPGPQITNPYLMKSLPYDPQKDLVPVSKLAVVPSVLVAGKRLPVASVRELVAYAKAHPHEVRFASAGIGASSHLAGELFKAMASIEIDHVPYPGTGAALRDVLGGTVEIAIDSVAVYLPHIQSGAVKALGVTTPQSLPMLPGVPPIADDLAGFDASPVNYLTVPAGTPAAVIDKLNAAVAQVLAQPDLQRRMIDVGLLPESSTPQEMAAIVQREAAKWRQVIEVSGARLE
ncbi:Bug family tripartite tricarboxylate transporter substrate binding protein [Bordetella petrii]|uniref:Bug family tripartite tricarboxylate transporter substrate binding protein n=1 Tax=Bordetella petrii TaxID=94624 RepID=UPI00372EF988